MCSPIAAAISGEIAKTATNEILTKAWTNAKVRPRISSLTSIPNIVNPLTHETPAKRPITTTTKIAKTKFCKSESTINIEPATVSEAPKSRRRENCEKTFGPSAIPPASPVNTAPNKIPYAASPAFKSPTNVLAKPITAPAARNAPIIPMISPRISFVLKMNLAPSSNESVSDGVFRFK